MIVHLVLLAAALYFLPIAIPVSWLERAYANPVYQVLGALLLSVGFPFFVLSANAPLLQKWFSNSGHPAGSDPYFLYASSNAGSLLGLLAYPVWLEPRFTLIEQAWFWYCVYVGFFVVALLCGLAARNAGDSPTRAEVRSTDTKEAEPTLLRRLRWMILSFAPASLLLGVTTYITTDLASVPLLWVLPLSFYLVSFIVAFQRGSWASHPFIVRRQAFLLLAAAITFFVTATEPAVVLLPLHLLAFFATCLVCHGELAKDRPSAEHLTEYYLWISFGGVLGGFMNAFLAPLIFSRVQEYPLAMIAAALLRPPLVERSDRPVTYSRDLVCAATLFSIILGLVLWTGRSDLLSPRLEHVLIFGLSGVIGLSFAHRPVRFGLGIGAIMLATSWYDGPFGEVLFSERSFFGVYRAFRDGDRNLIFHGTTLHGAQNLDPAKRLQPTSYYYPAGPGAEAFSRLSQSMPDKPVAVIGLGAGALACYGKAEQEFVFYEIDPLVERIARNPDLFTYLRDCPARASVKIGDARLMLVKAPSRHYGLLVLDAFSGDSIPIHLLTREAVELYISKLLPEGALLFHISNRYMNLAPVVDRVSQELKLTAFLRDDFDIDEREGAEGKQPSQWVVMARPGGVLAAFASDSKWKRLTGHMNSDLWTDNYSNVLQTLRWR